jgi:dTDP-4-dehydrorhamnose reductase
MKIAITGAAGLDGRHLAERLAVRHDVRSLKHAELDVTDGPGVLRLVAGERPQLIINCAVVGVDECERDPVKARAVNVGGPKNLAEAAAAEGAETIHFSSNYLFDWKETGREPYTADDEVRPLNAYGRTKLEGEEAVRLAAPRGYIIRTSWVCGQGKDSFLGTAAKRLNSGKAVRAITDTWAKTTYVEDLVSRVEEILIYRRYGTYHLVNEGVCSYYHFAREAARLVGLSEDEANRLIEPAREDETGREAIRPRYTPMRCLLSEDLGLSPMRGWREALAAYVKESGR